MDYPMGNPRKRRRVSLSGRRSRNSFGGSSFTRTAYAGGGGGGRRQGGRLGQEVKTIDQQLGVGTLTQDVLTSQCDMSPTVPKCLNACKQGAGGSDRIGRFIKVKRVTIKGQVIMEADTMANNGLGSGTVRLLLVLDTANNLDSNLVAADLFIQAPAALDGVCQSFQDVGTQKRFRILADRTIVMNPSGTAGNGTANTNNTVTRSFVIDKRLNMNVSYPTSVDPPTKAEIEDNCLMLFALSNSNSINATTPVLKIKYVSRVRFVG